MTDTHKNWVVITDVGFSDEAQVEFADGPDGLASDTAARSVFVQNHISSDALKPYLDRLELIAIDFPSYADGRGMSLATELRRLGFEKTLQARGHVIPDQYAQMRRCGFDQVAITDAQAKRQPEANWLEQVAVINNTYQVRLEQAAKVA
ncbi:MAG: DUF934 domain-containing protein [Pseudomonadota bacterium]